MGFAGTGRNETGVMTNIDDFCFFGGVIVNLFIGAGCQKYAERIDNRQKPMQRQAPCRRYHILLGNTVFNESFRKGLLKRPQSAVGRQVGIQDDDVLSVRPDFYQGFTVGADNLLGGGFQ